MGRVMRFITKIAIGVCVFLDTVDVIMPSQQIVQKRKLAIFL